MPKPRLCIAYRQNDKVDITVDTFIDALDEWYNAGFNDGYAESKNFAQYHCTNNPFNEPKSKAIPVEWLEKQADKYIELGLNSVAKQIQIIIYEWERENAKAD